MTNEERMRVEEIRSMEATTPDGHWYAKQHNENYGQGYGATTYFVDVGPEIIKIGMGENSNDCTKYYAFSRFIAAARSDIPFLLDLVKRQEEKASSLTAALADRNAEIERLEALVDGLRCAETYYLGYKAALSKAEKRAEAAIADMTKLAMLCDKSGSECMCTFCRHYTGDPIESCTEYGEDQDGNIIGECHFEWNDQTAEQEE